MDILSLSHKKKIKMTQFLSDSPLVLVYFNTDCHFCQGEIKNLEDHYKLLNGFDFLFISSQSSIKIKKFITDYHLASFPKWNVMQDSLHLFKKIFGTNIYPNTYIYGSKGMLIKHFKGETSAKAIIRVLKKRSN